MSDLSLIRIDTHKAAIRASIYEQQLRDAGHGAPTPIPRHPNQRTQGARFAQGLLYEGPR